MKTHKLYRMIIILSGLGLLLSTYLLWQQFFRPAFQPCSINSFINCDAVISGPVAKTMGIPTPLYGFIGYIIIFYAAIRAIKRVLLGMAGFGLIFCLYLAFVELFVLRVICPVCIACQIVMAVIFILALRIFRVNNELNKQGVIS